jgi:hypothetical protein
MAIKIILIHPPLAKCSEPPAGIARLSACLSANSIQHEIIDANMEGILYLLEYTAVNNSKTDKWTMRATKNLKGNLGALRNSETYQNPSRYQRAVMDINHILNVAGKSWQVDLSLAD